jgi:XTP/dITP diphosphohydrolase
MVPLAPARERRLLVASTNQHKIEEFGTILASVPVQLVSPLDLGLRVNLQETGSTYAENAILKAMAYADAAHLPVLADDSGLEIDALNGEPGVYSSRWAGEGVSYPERFGILFERLATVPAELRTARYRCVIAIAEPAPRGLYDVVDGTFEGQIAFTPAGTTGFGYDPIFYVPELNRTIGQMSAEEKHRISHRGKAGAKAAAVLANLYDPDDHENGSSGH